MTIERVAYLVREDGVTPIRFRCDGDHCTNVDDITMETGAWLDFGDGITMSVTELLASKED